MRLAARIDDNHAMLIIGIDPGVTTGFAIWDRADKIFSVVESMGIIEAMDRISEAHRNDVPIMVVFEDARMRGGSKAASYGAGAIRRECAIWAEFLAYMQTNGPMPFRAISPRQKGAKLNADQFRRLTGWTERTNEHARDAAMLVFGM